MINVEKIRKDFPVYAHNPNLIYADSSATVLKPQPVIDAVNEYMTQYPVNIHRGLYPLSEKATAKYEESRTVVADLLDVSAEEVIFTKGTTESLNFVAQMCEQIIKPEDEILVTNLEHHSNFVPWQELCKRTGAKFIVSECVRKGEVVENIVLEIKRSITAKTKVISITACSNVLGIIMPLKEIVSTARKINREVIIVVDGAQAVAHYAIHPYELDIDFLAFSGHKLGGPTGIGVLWGKKSHLDKFHPIHFGGDMISKVTLKTTEYQKPPIKFESGTPPIAEVIGLGASIKYLQKIGFEHIKNHENKLREYLIQQLNSKFGKEMQILPSSRKYEYLAIVSFSYKNHHPHDIAQIFADNGIAVRAGHQCAEPLHEACGLQASTRISLYIYNSTHDVDRIINALQQVDSILS